MIEIRKYEKKDKNAPIPMPCTCMNDWALPNSVLSHRASA